MRSRGSSWRDDIFSMNGTYKAWDRTSIEVSRSVQWFASFLLTYGLKATLKKRMRKIGRLIKKYRGEVLVKTHVWETSLLGLAYLNDILVRDGYYQQGDVMKAYFNSYVIWEDNVEWPYNTLDKAMVTNPEAEENEDFVFINKGCFGYNSSFMLCLVMSFCHFSNLKYI